MIKNQIKRLMISTVLISIFCFSFGFADKISSKQLAKSNNDFALKLYDALKVDDENLFFSPYSISTALAMTYAGAKGKTKTEMAKVLEFHLSGDSLHAGFSQISSELNEIKKQGDVELSTANALWIEKSFSLLPNYKQLVNKYYNSEVFRTDFLKNSDNAVKQINNWVEEKTNDKIKNLLKPNNLSSLTKLVLTNAIYFKGLWDSQFDKRATRQLPFFISEKEKINTPIMFLKEKFKYAETENAQILEMPYKGKQLSMVIILPNEIEGIKKIGKIIKKEKLLEIQRYPQKVRVWLPKFTMTERYKLNKVFLKLGMKDAFDSRAANFSGMTGNEDLFISGIFHKAFIKVEEKGTEAAAATAVVMELKSAPPGKVTEFRADHPFLFYIQDNSTGSILFMGKVNRPSVESG